MTLTKSDLALALTLLGMLATAIYGIGTMKSELTALRADLARIEAQCSKLDDKLYWLRVDTGQMGPILDRR